MTVGILVGNPKPCSRTYAAAHHVASELSVVRPQVVIDLADLGTCLLQPGAIEVDEAIAKIRAVDLLVVASPTYKATYTGLLKLFLDLLPPDGLAGTTAIPLMLGAGQAHALAPELLLKPVLVELGASTPTKALYLLDSEWQASPALNKWLPKSRKTLEKLGLIDEHRRVLDAIAT
jgi:FMN reductase